MWIWNAKSPATNQEFWCLLRSDAHHDNPHSDNRMEKRHLDEALEKKAFIIDNGDAFCAMQGKGDPRASKNDIKEEHTKGSYLDSLVSTYADFLEPYAQNIAIMEKGNHELSVYKHRETDLTERLVSLLNGRTGSHIKSGQIANWIGFPELETRAKENVRRYLPKRFGFIFSWVRRRRTGHKGSHWCESYGSCFTRC